MKEIPVILKQEDREQRGEADKNDGQFHIKALEGKRVKMAPETAIR